MFAILAVVGLWLFPRLQAQTGTLVVVGAGRAEASVPKTALSLEATDGSWIPAGDVAGSVPAAPDQRELLVVAFPVGRYEHIRFRGDVERVSITVTAGRVEPLLLGFDSSNLIPGAVYAGNDEVNLGLGELAGKFVPMPQFALVDQNLRDFNSFSTAGKDVVIGAFHTTCHETCPLYTALFFQLAKRVSLSTTTLAEVTTDPDVDTPSVLLDYRSRIGATWEFVSGTRDQVASFWKQFGVDLSSGDSHTSTLVLIDRHGYIRLIYRGAPNVGRDMPPSLVSSLSADGLKQLASGGDGWGAPDVLQALVTIAGPPQTPQPNGGKAPSFTLASTDGGTVSLSQLSGPLVINFWRSDCPPCRAEMPLLQQRVGPQSGARLILINSGESPQSARAFLDRMGIRQAALLDSDLTVGRAYGVSALPATVFVRADGTIDRRQVGQLDDRVLSSELSNLVSQ